jgi:hypothetical protein
MEDKQINASFVISLQIKQKIEEIATANHRTFSQQMRLLVEDCIEKHEQSKIGA